MTSEKFVPGSKGSGGQPVDKNELPSGDETLPWRQKHATQSVTKVTQKTSEVQKVLVGEQRPQQVQPWTQEQISLKKTQIEKKEIVKEQIEEVQLKASKIQSKEIEKLTLEKVELKHKPRKAEEATSIDTTVETEDTTLLDTDEIKTSTQLPKKLKVKEERGPISDIEKLKYTEDTTLLSVEETEKTKQFTQTATKGWRKPKPEETTLTQRNLEDATLLSIDETENIKERKSSEVRGWRGPKHPAKRTDIEDSTLLSVEETEQVEQRKAEVKGWRTPKQDKTAIDKRRETDESTRLEIENVIDQTISKPARKPEKLQQPQEEILMPAEPVPWNKQEIKLKPTPREKIEIPKEKIEDVQLKPARRESKTLLQEDSTTIVSEKVKAKDTEGKTEKAQVEDITTLKLEEKQEETEEKKTKREKIRKELPRREEPIPWTQQQIELKPTRRGSKTTSEVENLLDLQTVEKPSEILSKVPTKVVEDTSITKIDENAQVKQWRKARRVESEEIIETVESKEKSKSVPKREEPIPWTQQQIELKPTPREKKEIPLEKPNEIPLQLTRRGSKPTEESTDTPSITESGGEKQKGKIKRLAKEHEEESEIKVEEKDERRFKPKEPVPWTQEEIKLKPTTRDQKEIPDETLEVELKSVKHISKSLSKELELVIPKPEEAIIEETKPIEAEKDEISTKKPIKDEQIPWNKQEIILKKSRRERKEVVKDTVEDVQLKPIKKPTSEKTELLTHVEDKKIIDLEETRREQVSKPITSQKEELIDKTSSHDTKTEEDKLEVKDWRRPKKPKEITEGPKTEQVRPLEETELQHPEKKEEPIPWNKQQIVLKRAPKEKKDITKQQVEEVKLKSVVKTTTEEDVDNRDKKKDVEDRIDSDEVREEDLRVKSKTKKEAITDDKIPETETIHTDHKKLLFPEETEEPQHVPEVRGWRRPKKETKLDTTSTTATDSTQVEELEEAPSKVKSWRKPRQDVPLKESKPEEQPSEESTVEPTSEIEKPEESKKPKIEIKKVEKLPAPISDEIVPWNKQEIVLKRAKQEKKVIEKETPEEITLKPYRPKPQQLTPDQSMEEKPTIKEDMTGKKPLVSEEGKILEAEQTEPKVKTIVTKVPKSEEPVSLEEKEVKTEGKEVAPKVKKPKEELSKPELIDKVLPLESVTTTQPEEITVTDKKSAETKQKDQTEKLESKPVPWTEEVVKLKRTPKIKKSPDEEQLETVSLKPIKKSTEISDVEDSAAKPIVLDEKVETLSKVKRSKKPKKGKSDAGVDEEVPEEITEVKEDKVAVIPEEVIVETVTEIEDTVVLKLDQPTKVKPKDDKPKKPAETTKEDTLEMVKLKPAKRSEKPEVTEEYETVRLKPVKKFEGEEAKITEKEKVIRRKKYKDVELPEDGEKYVAEEVDKVEFEETPKAVEEKPAVPWRKEPKPTPDISDEKIPSIKLGKGKLPKEEEQKEDVRLKPVKKDIIEEQKPSELIKQGKVPTTDFVPTELEPQPFESKPDKLTKKKKHDKPEEFSLEKQPEETVVEDKPSAPWRRQPKQKIEEIPQDQEMPKGKRRPAEEKEQEPVKLKPFKKESPEAPQQQVVLESVPYQDSTVEDIKERDDSIKFKPWDRDEQPDVEKDKKKRFKPKKKDQEEVHPEDISQPEEQIPQETEEVSAPKEEQIPEVKQWRKGRQLPKPEKEEKETVQLKPIPREKEVIQPEEQEQPLVSEQKLTKVPKTVRKSKSHVLPKPEEEVVSLQDETPELVPTKLEEVPETVTEVTKSQESVAELKLKQEKIKEKVIGKEEKITGEEVIQFQKDMSVEIVSKKIKPEKRIVHFDDEGQPIPELEIISSKRVTEGIDKVPDEPLQEDIDVHEEKTVHKSIIKKTVKDRIKKKTIAPRFTKRVEPVVSEPEKPTKLICQVEGSPFPEIAWYKNEILLHATERVYWTIVENTVTLEFAKVEPQDIAIYSCRATNSAGVATTTANLVILGILCEVPCVSFLYVFMVLYFLPYYLFSLCMLLFGINYF